ncbi:hypothetical protein AB0D45_14185 [Streptomyces sp. NPDC048352]|uniref:hypothetical protein n=1 Tax=Streptomyces sp. NPDC048352 TaxID=3154718 RepID=UPI0034204B1B
MTRTTCTRLPSWSLLNTGSLDPPRWNAASGPEHDSAVSHPHHHPGDTRAEALIEGVVSAVRGGQDQRVRELITALATAAADPADL